MSYVRSLVAGPRIHIDKLIEEIQSLLADETRYYQQIEELSTDVKAFKSAYSTEAKRQALASVNVIHI